MAGRSESVILAKWEMMRADSGWSGLLGAKPRFQFGACVD